MKSVVVGMGVQGSKRKKFLEKILNSQLILLKNQILKT